jgi:hypothetical protein
MSGSAWNSLVDEDILYQTRASSPSDRTVGAWEYQAEASSPNAFGLVIHSCTTIPNSKTA